MIHSIKDAINYVENNLSKYKGSELGHALDFLIELGEKQIPNSRPCMMDENSVTCGNCDSDVDNEDGFEYCPYCGQRLRGLYE